MLTLQQSAGLVKFDQALDTARNVIDEPYYHGSGAYTWIVEHLSKLILEQKTSDSGEPYIGISNMPNTEIPFDDKTVDQIGNIAMVALRSVRSRAPHGDHIRKALISPVPYGPLYDFVRLAHQEDSIEARNARLHNELVPSQPSIIWTLFTTGDDLDAIAESQFQL